MSKVSALQAMRDTIDLALIHGMPMKSEREGLSLGAMLTMHQRVRDRAMSDTPFSEAKLNRTLGWMQCAVLAACPDLTITHMEHIIEGNKEMYLKKSPNTGTVTRRM